MRSGTHFEIEFESVGSTAVGKFIRASTEAEVLAFVNETLLPSTSLLIACLGGGVDFGNLIIEADSQGSCELRALEHRGFFVKGVSLEQALCALEYWLPSQNRTPNLQWQDE